MPNKSVGESKKQGALDHCEHTGRPAYIEVGVTLTQMRPTGLVNVRVRPDNLAVESIRNKLGCDLPTVPGTVESSSDCHILWIGPTEWLVTMSSCEGSVASEVLSAALAEFHAAVNDVSDSLHIIRVSGEDARLVLEKGCSLDLHQREFRPGRCARSVIAKATVLLHQTDDAPSFELYVDRSYAEYLWRWLEDAASTLVGVKRQE